jgi:phage gpG-like protein
MVAAAIFIDDSDLRAALMRAREFGPDTERASYDALGAAMDSCTLFHFEAEESPDGVPWPPSHRAVLQGGKTLQDKRYMRNSTTHNVLPDGVEWGVGMFYAAVHQGGAVIRPKSAKHLYFTGADGHLRAVDQVTIPERPMVGFGPMEREEANRVLSDALARALGQPESPGGAPQ